MPHVKFTVKATYSFLSHHSISFFSALNSLFLLLIIPFLSLYIRGSAFSRFHYNDFHGPPNQDWSLFLLLAICLKHTSIIKPIKLDCNSFSLYEYFPSRLRHLESRNRISLIFLSATPNTWPHEISIFAWMKLIQWTLSALIIFHANYYTNLTWKDDFLLNQTSLSNMPRKWRILGTPKTLVLIGCGSEFPPHSLIRKTLL